MSIPQVMRKVSPPPARPEYVAAAERIAGRVCRLAQWHGEACTWDVVVPDRMDIASSRIRAEPAGGDLYQGTAGIALFLVEFYGVSGVTEIRETAVAALRHSVACAQMLEPHAFGLYTGRVGVAHVLARYAHATGDEWALDAARTVVAPLFGRESRDQRMDVIGGAAGAIPILLQLADTLDLAQARASAALLGDHLVRMARRRPEGWSWGIPGVGNVRDLTGLAHGAAGIGGALLELWLATRRPEFLYAAEQAFGYERYHFDADVGNWPDYRCSEWDALVARSDRQELLGTQSPVERPHPITYRPRYMTAWCHGAPGIGLTRLRAWQLRGDPRFAAEARTAADTTARQLRDNPPDNYSLCHGVFGSCELLIAAAGPLAVSGWRAEAERQAGEAIARFGAPGHLWPSGAVARRPDPSFMLGDAGIGHFLLRLGVTTVPNILAPVLPWAGCSAVASVDEATVLEACRASDENAYFGRTLRVLDRVGGGKAVRSGARAQAGVPPVMALADAIERWFATVPTSETVRVADGTKLDWARYAAVRTQPTYVDEFLAQLRQPPTSTMDSTSVRFRMAPGARVCTVECDWDAWLEAPSMQALPTPEHHALAFVLFLRSGVVRAQRLGPFSTAVLTSVPEAGAAHGASLAQLTACVLDLVGTAGGGPPAVGPGLHDRVRQQLGRALEVGIVHITHSADCVGSEPDAPATPARTDKSIVAASHT